MWSRTFWGLLLVVIGACILLSNFGILNFDRDWPFILIIMGFYLLVRPSGKKPKKPDVRKILDRLEKGEIDSQTAARLIKEEKNE